MNLHIFQGDYIWIEPISDKEFDVAIGARVVSAEGRRIQVKDDDNKVCDPIAYHFSGIDDVLEFVQASTHLHTSCSTTTNSRRDLSGTLLIS